MQLLCPPSCRDHYRRRYWPGVRRKYLTGGYPYVMPWKVERGDPVADTGESAYDAADLRRARGPSKFFSGSLATEAITQQAQTASAQPNVISRHQCWYQS